MSQVIDVTVPDIGDFSDIPVIEVCVGAGDHVRAEDTLVTLESDKATLDIPCPADGIVEAVLVETGALVSMGSPILRLRQDASGSAVAIPASAPAAAATAAVPSAAAAAASNVAQDTSIKLVSAPGAATAEASPTRTDFAASLINVPYASPSTRAFARELGISDLGQIRGTGAKGRITREDVTAYIKAQLAAPRQGVQATVTAGDLPPWPVVDFASYGPVEREPLSRIRKISGPNLARNWVTIPHVTNFDEADVTDIEEFRKTVNKENAEQGIKVSLLAFLIKASVECLKVFPHFNSSLDGDSIVLKRYFHIGFAADTPNGLVVPVIRDADRKGILEIAGECAALAKKARAGKLAPSEMQGGCFTISSLGGIGGTGFTPIINAPEVAILGVTKAQTKAVWTGDAFVPRTILPVSLSWDHRVVDGASAGRFLVHLTKLLGDFRRASL